MAGRGKLRDEFVQPRRIESGANESRSQFPCVDNVMCLEPRRDNIRAVAALQRIEGRSVRETLQRIVRSRGQMLHVTVIESSHQFAEKALQVVRRLLQMCSGTLGGC